MFWVEFQEAFLLTAADPIFVCLELALAATIIWSAYDPFSNAARIIRRRLRP